MIPESGRRDIALSIENIWKVEKHETDNPLQAIVKDIFMFMFYCNGLNFGVLCRLRYENVDAASGEIIFQRKKTLRKGEKPTFIYAPLLPPMVEIINRLVYKEQNGYISHLVSELLANTIVVRKMVGHSTKKNVTAGCENLTAKKRLEINSKLLNPEKKYTAINLVRIK